MRLHLLVLQPLAALFELQDSAYKVVVREFANTVEGVSVLLLSDLFGFNFKLPIKPCFCEKCLHLEGLPDIWVPQDHGGDIADLH